VFSGRLDPRLESRQRGEHHKGEADETVIFLHESRCPAGRSNHRSEALLPHLDDVRPRQQFSDRVRGPFVGKPVLASVVEDLVIAGAGHHEAAAWTTAAGPVSPSPAAATR